MKVLPVIWLTASMICVRSASRNAGVIVVCCWPCAGCGGCCAGAAPQVSAHATASAVRRARVALFLKIVMDGPWLSLAG